jgi:GDP-fucose transporter C1
MAVNMQVVGVVMFYMVAALIMVFVNKVVLNSTPNLPLLFMFFQSMITVLLLHITSLFSSHIQLPSLDLTTANKLAPLIIIDAAGFTFNALCLRDVEAAFYQIARGMVLPLTIAVVAISSRTPPALPVVGCATIVMFGFFVGVTRSADLPEHSVPGPLALFYGFLSSLAIALHAVLVKTSLPFVDGSSTKLCYWQNLGAGLILCIIILFKGEVVDFVGMARSGTWDWTTFAWGNFVTGIFGFLISVAGILSVKVTSPVTHMFSSAARSVLQVALGVKIFGDVITTKRAASVLTILVGTLLYTWVKSRETSYSSPPKETSRYFTRNIHEARSTTQLLEPGGDLSDEERSISDVSEIFSTGGHSDDDDDEFGYALKKRTDHASNT